jgi:hypothetical protein
MPLAAAVLPERSSLSGPSREKPGQYTQLQFLLSVELGFGKGGVFPRAADRVWHEPQVQHRFRMRREYTILERGGVS